MPLRRRRTTPNVADIRSSQGPALLDLAFANASNAAFVRGGPGQEFAEVYRSADAGLNWKLVRI